MLCKLVEFSSRDVHNQMGIGDSNKSLYDVTAEDSSIISYQSDDLEIHDQLFHTDTRKSYYDLVPMEGEGESEGGGEIIEERDSSIVNANSKKPCNGVVDVNGEKFLCAVFPRINGLCNITIMESEEASRRQIVGLQYFDFPMDKVTLVTITYNHFGISGTWKKTLLQKSEYKLLR